MFLGKGVLKVCSIFTGEHPCRSVVSINLPWKVSQSSQAKWNGAFSLGTLGAFQNSRNFEKTLKRLLRFKYMETIIYVFSYNKHLRIWKQCWNAEGSNLVEIGPLSSSNWNNYWNHTLALVFSWKFAAYFQKVFSQEHLWVVASVLWRSLKNFIKTLLFII